MTPLDAIKTKITDKTIILGVFGTDTYYKIENEFGAKTWSEFKQWSNADIFSYSVLKRVEYAGKIADLIIFVLDGVKFPINPALSMTCGELELICRNEDLFNKTIFVRGEEVINFDKHLVI